MNSNATRWDADQYITDAWGTWEAIEATATAGEVADADYAAIRAGVLGVEEPVPEPDPMDDTQDEIEAEVERRAADLLAVCRMKVADRCA